MKIAILGTKGIPNNYGGYEQFAEFISTRLVERGHQVTVYNPSFHAYRETMFKGVEIKRVFSPEKFIGGAANIVYDHLCLSDALKNDFDIIYEAGYHSVALSLRFFKVNRFKRPVVITNMDGLEWKRTKWNKQVQNIIKKLEKIAVEHSPYLISDNIGIQEYLTEKYGKDSYYIPYGADPVNNFSQAFLQEYEVLPHSYFMLVARLEPENNIETILRGYQQAKIEQKMMVVGNHKTKYGQYLKEKFSEVNISFAGGIYEKPKLDSLRYFAQAYFHGHSVGGTNPSLLEAMACKSFIWAHQNSFNKSILGEDALYFSTYDDVIKLLQSVSRLRQDHFDKFQKNNSLKIQELYNWDVIVSQHEKIFRQLIK
jgi:glycosyltransferase involved in cell wall biosynthesis